MRWMSIAFVLTCLAVGCGDDSSSGTHDAQVIDSTAIDAALDAPPLLSLDERVRACAIVGACTAYDLNQCLFFMDNSQVPNQVSCLITATAANCLAVRACLGQRPVTTTCTPGCVDGDTRRFCTSGSTGFELDCPLALEQVGPMCITNGRTDCGGATCTVDGEYTCAGPVSSTCDSGITEVFDCSKRGLECVTRAARCVGIASGSCTSGAPAACDGDVIVTCDGGVERREDCSLFGGRTCIPGTPPRCGLASECVAGTSDDTCSGNVLQACVAGKLMSIDCTTIGATTCMMEATIDSHCE